MTRILLSGFAMAIALLIVPLLSAVDAFRTLGNLIRAGWRYSLDYVTSALRLSTMGDPGGVTYASVQLSKVRSFTTRRLARIGPLLTRSPAFA